MTIIVNEIRIGWELRFKDWKLALEIQLSNSKSCKIYLCNCVLMCLTVNYSNNHHLSLNAGPFFLTVAVFVSFLSSLIIK